MKWDDPLPESIPVPLWFQIAERLRTAIKRGDFQPGETLPSEARLNQKVRLFEDQLKHGDHSELKRMQLRSAQLADEIDRVAQDSHDFSLEFGQGGRQSAAERACDRERG